MLEIFSGEVIYNDNDLMCGYVLCNANYKYSTDFYTDEPIIINYQRDEYGFRGRTKKINEIDIITVGGSTTDERFLNLQDTWSEVLEKLYKLDEQSIDIVNAGIVGQSTHGHIWSFENWFNKIDSLSTKYFIFYIGLNESHYKSDNDYSNTDELSLKRKLRLWFIKNNGITYKLYKNFHLKRNITDILNVGHKKRNKVYNKINYKLNINNKFKSSFIKRLHKLTTLSRQYNATPIFITQKSFRWKIIDNDIYSVDDYDYYSVEKQKSNIVIDFCEKNGLLCINGFELFNLNVDDSYDLVHLSPSGSKKIAEEIYRHLKDLEF